MFIDFKDIATDTIEGDLCIVGSGAAGISLALEFAGHPCRVLLIESGSDVPDAETTDLYRGFSAPDAPREYSPDGGRARVFGGTTTLWGGQALPFTPIDFEKREWVADSGWPFPAEELRPYWTRAGAVMNLRDVAFEDDLHAAFGIRRPDFRPEIVHHIYSRWSPQPNFAIAYGARLRAAENITVVRHANVTQILASADGARIEGLEVRSLTGGPAKIARAKFHVVCCGGIETPRLLLASGRERFNGVGNAHDLVGRYFQEHCSVRWAEFIPADRARADSLFSSFLRGKTKYFPLFEAGEDFQRRHRTLNISAAVVMERSADSGIEAFKRFFRAVAGRRFKEISLRDGTRALAAVPDIFHLAWRVGLQHRSYLDPREPLYLGSLVEQEPNFHSRISLDPRVDALGMPRVLMDWRPTPLTHRTLVAFAREMQAEFRRLGLGEVRPYAWLANEEEPAEPVFHCSAHHMGATRMHADPRHGVVDADCKVHGIDNLYLGSSSVFPTSGHSNPTFTMLCLCFRLADKLKSRLLAPPPNLG